MASVKVAVRVRPLNKRERDMDAKTCIYMEDKKTVISNFHAPGSTAGEDKKDFTFDYSYWSADSSDKHYASQEQVFKDLGSDVLESAFEGYNACIFAYGQTGAGKSYSMMGMQEAPGLIPRICQGLYARMNSCADKKTEFRTEVSYLEIYNEKVRDLLQPAKGKDHFTLKVREHPKEGPYVQDLTSHHVTDYEGIERLMSSGNSNRTVASTNMNDVSSRSHAIFTINFTQAKFHENMPSETLSKINLVDLAGSERANSTGATGSRLKEGANINKSLVTLGTVISCLADACDHHSPRDSKKKFFIPYRNSVLTWLLKDSLGGNAKTIMIAAISPADVNYSETLSTLRYANRAKNIINKPTVNEDPNVKLIRELRSEIERLKLLLKDKVDNGLDLSIGEAEKNIIHEQLHENEAKVEELTKNWTTKWRETQKIIEERALGFRYEGMGVKMESQLPHLVCIDDDVLSTGITLYHLKDGLTYMGKEGANTTPEIVLSGPGIEDETCIIESIDGNVIIHPVAGNCQLNGQALAKAKRLSQGDVLLLGKTNMFRFNHPQEAAKLRKQRQYESMENLADIGGESERTPSYLFYNAGLELERQYKEETERIEQKKLELEVQQQEAARKLEEARQELEFLKEQHEKAAETRTVEEEERKRQMRENQLQLEKQKKYLEELRVEQEQARQRAEAEIQEVKERIKREQDEERKRLEAEMQRLLALEEQHRKTVLAKEIEMNKMKEDLEKKWGEERRHVELQRQQVKALQEEIDVKRKEVEQVEKQMKLNADVGRVSPGRVSPRRRHSDEEDEEEEDEIPDGANAKAANKSRIEALRAQLRQLEAEFEDQRKIAQKEISEAKDEVHKAEQEALKGLRSLTTEKSAIERQWRVLEEVQEKHKQIQEEQIEKMRDLREILERAEEAEEADLIQKEKAIMERRAARHKVEEARRKQEELEHEDKNVDLTEEDFAKRKELLECETREEIKDIREERKILSELHSKHQTALQKATQMVTETKTKLEKHLESERMMLVPMRAKVENLVRNELGPLIEAEQEIERRCEDVDFESRDRKKLIYRQRKRIALLERQHQQALQQAEKETLNEEELEELENEREAEQSLIRKEKVRLLELEKKHKEQQEMAELTIGEAVQELEKRKSQVNQNLENERKKLAEYELVHKETLEHIETELEARTEMLHRVRDKIQKDKRQLAKLDVRQQRCAAKAAEELFLMADLLEKEMTDKGKSDELAKIKEHRKKLHELDRQLRMTERREKGGKGEDDQNPCTLY